MMNKSKKCTGLCWRCQLKEYGCVWPHTEMFAAREALTIAKANTEYLVVPVAEILVSAVEKQIPMPVKIKTSLEGKFSGWWNVDGTYHVSVHYNAYCQNCGHKVERGVKGMGAGFEHNKDEQYCQYCGQKLWWPKN